MTQPRQTIARTAYALHCKGWDDDRIAEHLAVHRRTVIKAIEQTRARVDRMLLAQALELRATQHATLNMLLSEVWEQWDASKKPHVRARKVTDTHTKHRRHADGTATPILESKTSEEQLQETDHGDAQLAMVLVRILENIRSLHGMDAPLKIAPTTPDGRPLLPEMSPQERYRRIEAMRVLAEHPDTFTPLPAPPLPPGGLDELAASFFSKPSAEEPGQS